MLPSKIAVWKRKRVDVEARIQKLEAISEQIGDWKTNVSDNRTRLFSNINDFNQFIGNKEQQLSQLVEENNQKLRDSRQTLWEIEGKIRESEKKQRERPSKVLPLAIVLALVMMIGFGAVFLDPTITGFGVAEFDISIAGRDSYAASEQPIFTISLEERGNLLTGFAVGPPPDQNISATLRDPSGKESVLDEEIFETDEGFSIALGKGREFRAGLYTLTVTTIHNGEEIVEQQNFTWGVLAINTHKSIYLPSEEAFIGMAVLDDQGRMVCDADVVLEITDPSAGTTVLSTENGTIAISPECEVYGVTNLPDYYADYNVTGIGNYTMSLTATTDNGVSSMVDQFEVAEEVAFDVARTGPTRIYPVVPYNMGFTITAREDYSGTIREFVPASFEIVEQEGLSVTTIGDTKELTWNRELSTGEPETLSYEFDAPDTSPEFYVVGPLEIGTWKEAREWQIASDVSTQRNISYQNNPDIVVKNITTADTITVDVATTINVTLNVTNGNATGFGLGSWPINVSLYNVTINSPTIARWPSETLTHGSTTLYVETGDFNQDGLVDMVVGDENKELG